MANTPVEFTGPSGMSTVTLELYPYGSDMIANGAGGDSATEATNAKGIYTATVTQSITGWHRAVVKAAGTPVGVYDVLLADITAIHRCEDANPSLVTPKNIIITDYDLQVE